MFLSRPDASLFHRAPRPTDARLLLRSLGTAGFVLELAGRTLAIDPFVSRPGILRTLFCRLIPDAETIARHIPHADDVLVGHSHYDHVLDAPTLCLQTGARLIGSPSTANCGRAAGLPEAQIVETRGGEEIRAGQVTLRGLPSRHGRVYFNRVTLPGAIEEPPPWPPRLRDLRHGQVLNWHVEGDGLSLVHIDSADFITEELEGLRADVLCLCAIGRRYRPDYVQEAVEKLRPDYIVACHWDWFFGQIAEGASDQPLLPGVDLPGFLEEIRRAGPVPVVLPFAGEFGL